MLINYDNLNCNVIMFFRKIGFDPSSGWVLEGHLTHASRTQIIFLKNKNYLSELRIVWVIYENLPDNNFK